MLLAFPPMKGIDEIRRENLRAQVTLAGSQRKLAAKIGVDPNQVYQWLRAKPGDKQQRNMGKSSARDAETALGLPRGWFDVDHSGETATQSQALSPGMAESRPKNNVKALRIAMQSLFSVLHERMQDVAEAVAADIVETAGTEFAAQGFLNTAIGILRGVQQTSEGVVPVAPPVPAAPKSKRARAG